MPDVSAVIFDLGQVLVVWDPAAAFAPELSGDEARARLAEMDFPSFNVRLDAGEDFEAVRADLARVHPEHVQYFDQYNARVADAVRGPVPGSAEIVEELAAGPTQIFGLTNWPAQYFHLAVPAAPAIGLLQDIVVSGEEKVAKPDPRLFSIAIDRFGVTPERTLYVDDSPANIETAGSLGLRTHHFTDARSLRAELTSLGLLRDPR